MPGSNGRSVAFRLVLAIACVVVCLSPLGATRAWAGSTPTLDEASSMLERGRVVAARDALLRLRSAAQGADRERALELLASADARMRHMSDEEIALQKAELALERGDLRKADLHANQVRKAESATGEQRARASSLLDRSAATRAELAPMIPGALEQAVRDYDAGRYAEAKAGLGSVSRSGVRLTRDQSRSLRRYQERIVELEREHGRPFEVDYVPMAVLGGAPAPAAAPAAVVAAASGMRQDDGSGEDWPGDELIDETAARADAQRVLAEAEAAFEAGRYNQARQLYTEATTIHAAYLAETELALARERLNDVRARVGAASGTVLDQTIAEREIIRQQVNEEVDNYIQQASEAIAAGDLDRARALIAQAEVSWDSAFAQGLFPEEVYRARMDRLDQIRAGIDNEERAILERGIDEAAGEAAAQQRSREAEARAQERRRINESLDRLRALQKEQKYEEALLVAEEVLFLDPNNPAANLMKDVLTDIVIYRDYMDVQRRKQLSYSREFAEIERAKIIPENVIEYPEDWPEISYKRGVDVAFAESAMDRRTLATLDSRTVPAIFEDSPLESVVTYLASVTDLNFDVDWASLDSIGIDRQTRVSMNARNVSAKTVLDRVLSKVSVDDIDHAGWQVQDGIVVVASEDDLARNTFVVVYDVRDLLFDPNDYRELPELDLDAALRESHRAMRAPQTGGILPDDLDALELPGGDRGRGPSKDEQLEQLVEIIQTNVDFAGWRDNGGDTGIVQSLNEQLIVTNTAKNHREVQGLLDRLREVRALQIAVEARILQVSTAFFERIGFDLDIYFNGNDTMSAVRRQTQGIAGLGTFFGEGDNLQFSDFVGTDGTNTVSGYGTDGTIDPATGLPNITFLQGTTAVPYAVPQNQSGWGVVPVQQGSDVITETLISSASAFAQTINALNPALGVAGTFLDDIQVDFLLEATQADQRSVELNSPRLTFSNGKAANISVGRQRAYVSQLTPVVGTSSAGFNPTVSTLNTGFSLLVQGVVSADRRYVTMNVEITTAELIQFRDQSVSIIAGGVGGSVGGDTVTDTFQVPEVLTTRIRTGLTVPDKGTALLGGQRVATEVDVESGVPVLSKIPIVNRFFTNTSTVQEESTLLILIKPQILIQSEQEDEFFPGLGDQVEALGF
jgi:Flp pilus assembly secretin CpaC/tetratricopeptide (TPR) repeat protein